METRVNDLAAKITHFCREHDFYEYMDNVGLSSDDRDKQIDEVCKVVGLSHFIKTLSKGYNTKT